MLEGVGLAAVIALFSRDRNALTTGGALAAVVVAAASVAAGWSWAVVLIIFFVAGTALSHVGGKEKRITTGDVVEKGGPRDAWQVFANGGPFAAAAVASLLWPSDLWQLLGAGAIAASSADTWSTEIGTLSPHAPRSIIGWSPVARGTSGGVTWLGIGAAIGGSGLIAFVTFLAGWPLRATCAALAGGFVGSVIDSVLGATLQVRRYCPRCGKATERVVHTCGTTTDIIGGIRWLDNDAVNAVSSIGGALVGAVCLL